MLKKMLEKMKTKPKFINLFVFIAKKKKMSKRTRTTTDASSSKGSKKPRILPPSPHGPFWNGTTSDPEIIAVLVNNRDDAFHYDAETSRLDLVQEVYGMSIKLYPSST